MDKFTDFVEEKIAARTMEKLRRNRMAPYFVKSAEEARELVKKLVPEGSVCFSGGSMTLRETGILDMLTGGNYDFRDPHSAPTPEEREKQRREAFSCDYFFASANAITENGEICNLDGMGSRVAPIIYGPKNVILVAGINKIVPDEAAARVRIKEIASPANAKRLSCKTPCSETGKCADCVSPERICCSYTCLGFQRIPDRIKVIIIGENLGY